MTANKPNLNSMMHPVLSDEQALSKMISITARHFEGILDKAGQPYILHCIRVMLKLQPHGLLLMAAGCGHDLLEDPSRTGARWTRSDLLQEGFADRLVNCIWNVTKEEGKTEEEYEEKVISTDDSILVKMPDVEDNSDLRRMKGTREKDFQRHLKYMALFARLQNRAIERGLLRV